MKIFESYIWNCTDKFTVMPAVRNATSALARVDLKIEALMEFEPPDLGDARFAKVRVRIAPRAELFSPLSLLLNLTGTCDYLVC